ncbi:uncharacterized protein LOC127788156 [Diospyros lotus]|uniref:uncharacterized protein LOC127788156 n=1 Tax=Diospyros lotus TaxID=55363 RepID=UPI00224DC15C|nr:uncharacterized protein LOC127788156 [Diospyros lotus]
MALVSMKQNQGELLKDFVSRFNMEALSIENFDHNVAMVAFQNALRPGPFAQSLAKTPPSTFTDILGRATKYINAEEVMQAKRAEHVEKKDKKKHPEERRRDDRREKHRPRWDSGGFTPLNAPRAEILATIEGKDYLKKPQPMKAPSDKRNRSKYCRFHRDHGHDTEECHQLKEEIQELINRGFLRSYVAKTAGEVPVMKDEKSSAVRLKRSRNVDPISFSDSDLPGYPTRNDPLVITAELGKWELRRILVDPGSSSEILYRQAFLGMGYEMTQLRAAKVPLVGFDGEAVYSEGIIQLPLTVGRGSRTSRVMLDILVADVPSAYNMILGRSGLNALRAIPSTYHMMMKFPTDRGTGEVWGDLRLARECYMASIGITKDKEAGSQKDADPPK